MEPADLLSIVRTSTAELVAAARAAGVDARVPTCEGWGTRDLAAHVAGVYRYVTGIVRSGERPERRERPEPLAGEAAFDDLQDAGDDLVAALEGTDPARPTWNWSWEPQVAAFWFRRMAHEAVIHCVDVQAAAGRTTDVEPHLAADGIDELLTVIVPPLAGQGRFPGLEAVGTLHVHCTDVEGEWLVVPGDGTADVRREHAKGDAALRGPAADLLLRLYIRGDGGEVVGDAGVLDRWRSSFRF